MLDFALWIQGTSRFGDRGTCRLEWGNGGLFSDWYNEAWPPQGMASGCAKE